MSDETRWHAWAGMGWPKAWREAFGMEEGDTGWPIKDEAGALVAVAATPETQAEIVDLRARLAAAERRAEEAERRLDHGAHDQPGECEWCDAYEKERARAEEAERERATLTKIANQAIDLKVRAEAAEARLRALWRAAPDAVWLELHIGTEVEQREASKIYAAALAEAGRFLIEHGGLDGPRALRSPGDPEEVT